MEAENDNAQRPSLPEPVIEVPLERFDRLLRLLERVAQGLERTLAQDEDNARRAARRAGPTTEEAEARVARVHKKWRGEK